MEGAPSVRIDKWLWAVRLFKSRTLAAAACSAGKVEVNGQTVKASRELRIGDIIKADIEPVIRTVKVTGLIEKRVGAKLVPQSLEDLTPPEEYAKPREKNLGGFVFRPRGAGRPTKKDRRKIEGLEW